MKINYDKLNKMIKIHAMPRWNNPDEEWPLRSGGGEIFIQKIIKKVRPLLAEEAMTENANENVLNVLSAHLNLLSIYEYMFAKIFVQNINENDFKENIQRFLYGSENIETRLRNLLTWAKVVQIPGENKKKGFSPQVASYLLAMSNPNDYPYCKPKAYRPAVLELLANESPKNDPVERFIHCQEFYSEVHEFLKNEYGLQNGNLLDVHSLFYLFQDLNWQIDTTPKKVTDNPPEEPLYNLLMDKHNVLIYGPPGTGKTMAALNLAQWWRYKYGDDTVRQITFHPSYSYEDFIEGFRPDKNNTGFVLCDGIFKKMCSRAKEDSNSKHLLLIDEINRGDVARIFGELITLMEGDKRGELCQTTLSQSGEDFFVPENLYLLGTMNTADKSISLMDLAIRRRFLFYPCLPNADLLNEDRKFFKKIENVQLSSLLVCINQRLMAVGIDRDRVLGHSFFLIPKSDSKPAETLINRIRFEVIPLIEEYCFTDRPLMKRVLGDLVSESGTVDDYLMDDSKRFFDALKTLTIN